MYILTIYISRQGSARLAQSVEHETLNLRVVGSSPTLGDIFPFVYKLRAKNDPQNTTKVVV